MAAIVFNTNLQPRLGKRERKTVGSSASGLTVASYTVTPSVAANKYGKNDILPQGAMLTVENQSLRYTIDGTAPVATSLGHLAVAGDVIVLDSYQKVKDFQAIREGGTDSVIEVTYLYGN